jgi:acyl-CoA thioester hydrolase
MKVSRVERRVIFAETDAMQVVYYGNYLKYFEVGRAEFFREFDFPFTHYIEKGLYLAVTEVAVKYHRPARYDDLLLIETRLTRVGHATLDLGYTIYNRETGEKLVTGMTGHAVLDEKGTLRRLEPDFAERMRALQIRSDPSDPARPRPGTRGPRA